MTKKSEMLTESQKNLFLKNAGLMTALEYEELEAGLRQEEAARLSDRRKQLKEAREKDLLSEMDLSLDEGADFDDDDLPGEEPEVDSIPDEIPPVDDVNDVPGEEGEGTMDIGMALDALGSALENLRAALGVPAAGEEVEAEVDVDMPPPADVTPMDEPVEDEIEEIVAETVKRTLTRIKKLDKKS